VDEEGKKSVTRNLAVTALVAVIMAGFVLAYLSLNPPGPSTRWAAHSPPV
jgi:hypothetical protein